MSTINNEIHFVVGVVVIILLAVNEIMKDEENVFHGVNNQTDLEVNVAVTVALVLNEITKDVEMCLTSMIKLTL